MNPADSGSVDDERSEILIVTVQHKNPTLHRLMKMETVATVRCGKEVVGSTVVMCV